jgi:hypothetical protein
MQHLNNDMDDLFRKAADAYPLNTDASSWEKVQAALEEEEKGNRRWPFFLLLLAIPIALGFFGYYYGVGKDMGKQEKNLQQRSPQKEMSSNEAVANTKAAASGSREDFKQGIGNVQQPLLHSGTQHTQTTVHAPVVNRDDATITIGNGSRKNGLSEQPSQPGFEASSSSITMKGGEPSPLSIELKNQREKNSFLTNPLRYTIHLPLLSPQLNEVRKPKEKGSQRLRRFYFGMIAGVDYTSVKWQKVERTGFDLGVVAGIRLNAKWSVESGVNYNKKYYYSRGAFFNTSEVYMPANSKITKVEGYCNMWELPLVVRRQLNSKWSAAAGVSSYLMKKEDYSLTYLYYQTNTSRAYQKVYESSHTYLLAALRLSAAYNIPLGNSGSVRVEPYYKAPLRKVGLGELPLQSAGIQVGLIKAL